MTPGLIFGLCVALLFVLIAARVPIGLALAAAGATGLLLLHDPQFAYATLGTSPFADLASYSLILVPMFMLMGIFIVNARIATDIFDFINVILRRVPGGLAYATLASSAGFAAVTGSSIATVVTIGRVAIGQMRRVGYPGGFAAALVASAGTLGILIPPSLMLVIYGILTQESIGALLLAALIPGIIATVAYGIVIWVWTLTNKSTVAAIRHAAAKVSTSGEANTSARAGDDGDSGALTMESKPSVSKKGLIGFVQIGFIAFVILGGIYTGFFTATESGAVAAAVCLIVMIALNFTRSFRKIFRLLADALREAAALTSMVSLLLVGGGIFTIFLVSTRIPMDLAKSIAEMDASPVLILTVIVLILIPLGMFLDGYTILLLTVPLFYPVITAIGFDGVWFGIIMVIMIEVSVITPPVGLNVFAAAAVDEGVSVEDIFKRVWPFILAMLAMVVLLTMFPELALWLPNTAKG